MSNQKKAKKHLRLHRKDLLFLSLIVTVTATLLTMILTATQQTAVVVLAVTIVLTVLILAVTGKAELVPATLRAILSEIRRMLKPIN